MCDMCNFGMKCILLVTKALKSNPCNRAYGHRMTYCICIDEGFAQR